jgi:hypothetical protein
VVDLGVTGKSTMDGDEDDDGSGELLLGTAEANCKDTLGDELGGAVELLGVLSKALKIHKHKNKFHSHFTEGSQILNF